MAIMNQVLEEKKGDKYVKEITSSSESVLSAQTGNATRELPHLCICNKERECTFSDVQESQ